MQFLKKVAKLKQKTNKNKIKILKIAGAVGAVATGILSAGLTFASGGLDTMVASGSASFLSVTGFAYSDLVTKVGTWIEMFLGAGLGLVDSLLPWIIALIIFGVVISLIYKAMRFLHIMR